MGSISTSKPTIRLEDVLELAPTWATLITGAYKPEQPILLEIEKRGESRRLHLE
jgi:hypothetical protein